MYSQFMMHGQKNIKLGRQVTDENKMRRMRIAGRIISYRPTLRICNIFCISEAKILNRMRSNVTSVRTLYVLFWWTAVVFPKIIKCRW